MKKLTVVLKQAKAHLAVLILRVLGGGLVAITKIALNQGMSPQVYTFYRYCVATIVVAPFAFVFDRKGKPAMTWSIFAKIVFLGSVDSVLVPNLFYTGLKYESPTFSMAMTNAVPAFSFFFAWIFRMEKVDIRRWQSQAKLLGIVVSVGGAMIMTFVRGPNLRFPWTKGDLHYHSSTSANNQVSFKGSILVTVACVSTSATYIIQAGILKTYPVGMTLSVLVSLVGVVEGAAIALAMEWNNPAAWSIRFDFQLLAVLYAGVIINGIFYYVQGVVLEEKGPVFFTVFFPLSTVVVAIISSFAVSETLSLGKIMGAVVIVIGLYLVLWGKAKDSAIDKTTSSSSSEHQQLKPVDDDAARATTRDGSV